MYKKTFIFIDSIKFVIKIKIVSLSKNASRDGCR